MDIVETAFDPETADPGTIVWHTSDGEGGPPDVAYQVILAKGESLWIGEITRDRYEDAGGDKMGLGGDGGWWIIHYKGKDAAVLGKVADGSAADDLAALIASQAARIAELEDANNDALAAEAKLNLVRKRMERLEAENKALKQVADFDYLETIVAENRLLRNLLKPFAEDADKWAETVPDDHRPLCTEPNSKTAHPGSETGFTVGDLRRARATLKGETS